MTVCTKSEQLRLFSQHQKYQPDNFPRGKLRGSPTSVGCCYTHSIHIHTDGWCAGKHEVTHQDSYVTHYRCMCVLCVSCIDSCQNQKLVETPSQRENNANSTLPVRSCCYGDCAFLQRNQCLTEVDHHIIMLQNNLKYVEFR